MKKILMIPIDNRPVCYCLPEQIAGFSDDFELILPPRDLLGGLTTKAKCEDILHWLSCVGEIDCAVISLDTIAYGGLVASRRSSDSFDEIEQRLQKLKEILNEKGAKTYAFSSIMRISNNNINEEEKEYWNLWGKKIFEYSYNLHKNGDKNPKDIPAEILADYLATRVRNFKVNKLYLKWFEQGVLDFLVYSKDDCAQYGLNVKEANELKEEIAQKSVSPLIKTGTEERTLAQKNVSPLIKTGADEIPLSLLCRAFCDIKNEQVKIYPKFLRPSETGLISKYEDVSILESVKGQIELCGATCAESQEEAQVVLLVNNFQNEQGELVMGVETEAFCGGFSLPQKPYAIADVLNANGADNYFVKTFLDKKIDWQNFLGYGAWNTSANTLGSVICALMVKFLSSGYDLNKFKEQQLTRFLDDWAYQANVRAELKKTCISPCKRVVKEKMKLFENQLFEKLEIGDVSISYEFPWERFFEIEIVIS